MKQLLGIDIGSTTSSLVLLDESLNIVHSSYLFHSGQIVETITLQLAEINLSHVSNFAYTSSCPDIFKNGKLADSRVAYISAARHFHTNPAALLIVGGEKFGLVSFNENGSYQNFRSNTSCAAGTGSFLDQQLSRLNLESISRLGELASGNKGKFPKIASRCSVFAKTDLIHAQQEGYSLAEICDGLCYGLAKNVIDAVFDEQEFDRLIVAGGVSLNSGVMKHLGSITGTELVIDAYSHLYGAIGAAITAAEAEEKNEKDSGKVHKISIGRLLTSRVKKKNYQNPPLELKLSEYPDFSANKEYLFRSTAFPKMGLVEISIYENVGHSSIVNGSSTENNPATGNDPSIDAYLGIDIGSTSTKAVILDMHKKVIAGLYTRTSGRPVEAMQIIFEAIDNIQKDENYKFNFLGAGTTGSGRKLIGKIINADTEPDEITAHARAAVELDPETDTIIEIGGQDSKFTILRDGIVTLSIMNNVCAAGTGSFIEEQANKLNCPLSEYAERASRADSPMTSDRCTVFMERDLNHYLNEGYSKDELLASVLHSVRENYLTKVTGKARVGNKIFFQGATAKNRALVAAFEQKLQKPIMVSRYCHLTGALGVALELHDLQPDHSHFRGINLWKNEIPVRSELCELCTNHCKLKIAEIGSETVAYGFLCGRDYETEVYVKQENEGFDLLKMHEKTFRFHPKTDTSSIKIGLPQVLHLTEELFLWQHFFDQLGIRSILNKNYSTAVKDGKKIADAEFCAPIAAAFGEVYRLDKEADYIFLPLFLEQGNNGRTSKLYCYYTQYISSMLSSTKAFRGGEKILMPLVRSLKSENHMFSELTSMLHRMGLNRISLKEVKGAYLNAQSIYNQKLEKWKELYTTEHDDDMVNVVLLGRPYTVLSRQMNNKIPEIIAKKGYNTFFMDMLPDNPELNGKHAALVKTMTWKYASKILQSADQVARSKQLYPILVTSFKCTPDSFVIEYFREIMEAYQKPYLILQLDEHDSAVGYETRIEAAIRSFTNHFEAGFMGEDIQNELKNGRGIVTGEISSQAMEDVGEILEEHNIAPELFTEAYQTAEDGFDLSDVKSGETNRLKGRKILIPGWDMYTGVLLEAMLDAAGYNAVIVPDTPESIQRSLNMNTGQCLPLSLVTQNAVEYIMDKKLDPSKVALWIPRGYLACNLPMFPHYMRKLLKRYDERMSEAIVYPGNAAFYDFSIKMGVNAYLVYLFAGSLHKVACKLRPYEKEKGATDKAVRRSLEMLADAFRKQQPKEPVVKKMMKLFDRIDIHPGERPKVAIFGDMYARDNDVFNQDLVRVIEENGGEALPTSYSEYLRIILKQTELRLFHEGRYLEHYNLRFLKYLIPLLEGKYNKYFEKYIKNIRPVNEELFDILEKHHLHLMQRGETVDNILKIENLVRSYDDISLFVATNPAYCCPSLVTEAMSASIEKMTGIPVVSIEYDGTMGAKNEDVIPYLQLGYEKIKAPEI